LIFRAQRADLEKTGSEYQATLTTFKHKFFLFREFNLFVHLLFTLLLPDKAAQRDITLE